MPLFKKEEGKVQELEEKLQFREKLNYVTNRINSASNIDEILIQLKEEILSLFDADRITIYAADPINKELYSKYIVGSEIKEIRVPIYPSSLSGYAAYKMDMVNIQDVYNTTELKKINPSLNFDGSWDQKSGYKTKQVLVAPIRFEYRLFGVIQLINKKGGGAFTKSDEKNILEIARILGIAFRNQARMVQTRFNYLISQNIIAEDELKKAISTAKERGKDIEKILIENFKVNKKDIGISLSQYYGCKFTEFSDRIIIPKTLTKGLNLAYLKKSLWVPIAFSNGKAIILIDNPNDPKIGEIKTLIKAKEYEFQIALKDDILKFIKSLEMDDSKSQASISDLLDELDVKKEDEDVDMEDSEIDENAATIVRLVNQIIIEGYEKGASDIHIEPNKGKKTTDIRYRIDGVCMKNLEIPFSHSKALISRIKIIANLDIAERRLPQDGKIKFIYKKSPIELRVATLPTVSGEDIVMRILTTGKSLPLEDLNFSERNYKHFKEIISRPYGIILVVGPTGSGKTTTLHAALASINTPERKIWTAEDPVEITQYGLRQVEVKPKIKYDFAAAMRSFLRADPDVIMVGEMRDHETAEIGVRASLTGHLVLSTLHTNSASETITRLIDMGIDPLNFADALLGILAQRLIRTLCIKCKGSYHPTKEEFESLVDAYGKEFFPELKTAYNDKFMLFRAKGCEFCNQTGYRGRAGIHELLIGTKRLKNLIQSKATMEEIKGQAIKDGMRTLYQDGITKVLKGISDLRQVRSVCMNQ
ncbi:MAG TPA: GspE/PulE family protein [Nitrospinota bacterium]|nr:GspE/PulE family protein [Nitrospinota bacterium]